MRLGFRDAESEVEGRTVVEDGDFETSDKRGYGRTQKETEPEDEVDSKLIKTQYNNKAVI
jgi:hypothetical protein